MRIGRARAAVIFSTASFAAGCGGGDGADEQRTPPPGNPAPRTASPVDVRVIRAWADDLRAGRIDAASRRFALPSTAANGTPPVTLGVRGDVLAFNASLPCGARLVRTVPRGRYTIGVFELTERRGGDCGTGTGGQAATAFLIRDGKIAEWLRVSVPPRSEGPDRPAPRPEPGAPPPRNPPEPSETV